MWKPFNIVSHPLRQKKVGHFHPSGINAPSNARRQEIASYSLRQSHRDKVSLQSYMGPCFPRTVTLLSSLLSFQTPALLFTTLIQVEVQPGSCWQTFQVEMDFAVLTKNYHVLTSSIWITFCALCNAPSKGIKTLLYIASASNKFLIRTAPNYLYEQAESESPKLITQKSFLELRVLFSKWIESGVEKQCYILF